MVFVLKISKDVWFENEQAFVLKTSNFDIAILPLIFVWFLMKGLGLDLIKKMIS